MPTTSALIPRSWLISTSSSSRHDCGSCGQRCRANSIRDTVPSRESHALNEGPFTFYLHFLFNKLPFMFHKNLCCFLSTSAPNFNTQDLLQSFVARKMNIKWSQIYVCLIHHNLCYGPRRQFWVIGCKFHTAYYGSTTTPCTHYNSKKPNIGKDRGQRHRDLAIVRGWKEGVGLLIITKQFQNPDQGFGNLFFAMVPPVVKEIVRLFTALE